MSKRNYCSEEYRTKKPAPSFERTFEIFKDMWGKIVNDDGTHPKDPSSKKCALCPTCKGVEWRKIPPKEDGGLDNQLAWICENCAKSLEENS